MHKTRYDDKLVAEFFRKCFLSVDGLWFVKVEEAFSFDTALDIDVAVWRVLPKIEARTIKRLLSLDDDFESLRAAFDFKLAAEEYRYSITPIEAGRFEIQVLDCPWVNHITKAGRAHVLDRIADAVCPVEYEMFAKEFCNGIQVRHKRTDCHTQHHCVFCFHEAGVGSQKTE